jgi:CHAT domain-containing protein
MAARSFVGAKAYADAQQHLRALEELAGTDWWRQHREPWEMLGLYGSVSEGLGSLSRALTYYDQAIAELEAYRGRLSRDELKVGLANRRYYLYLKATRTALRLSDAARDRGESTQADAFLAQAFDYTERGKARALLDLMTGSVSMAGGREESQLLSRWRRLNAELGLCHDLLQAQYNQADAQPDRIAQLEQRVVAGRAELAKVEANLATTHPRLAQAINPQAKVMSLEAIRQALPPDTLMLVYAFLESIHGEGLIVWGIAPETVRHYRCDVDARLLDRQIIVFHRACAGKAAKDDAAGWLSRTLLEPFADLLEQYTNLTVVPHGSAHSLPFHALPWQGQPLAETHALSYLPSASALGLLSRKGQARSSERLLAVGNPSDMAYRLPLTGELLRPVALSGAEIEATYVATLFDESLVLLGDKATEESVGKHLERYRVIHLATHGYLSEEAPLLSSVLLANGESLSVYELLGLRLDADLVVLSACETARGEITGGDEVLGLTRGLLASGAGAAVVSLWPVNDISTSLFMGEFYRRLRGGDVPAAALQSAQRYLRCMAVDRVDAEVERMRVVLQEGGADTVVQDLMGTVRHVKPVDAPAEMDPEHPYSHPFYWAPFILVG